MDVHGNVDSENRNVIVHKRHSGLNQQWEILYADTAKPEPTSGLNPDFGIYINRPFHIVSHLGEKRYLDMIGRKLVIKTRNGFKSQIFYFDQRTRTIKSQQNKGWSFDIQNSGRSHNMQMWNTNSGWF